jgi:four helix bundle protein
MDLLVEVYRVSKLFPRSERFGLTSQLRRAAVSVPSNIAEGHCRDRLGDYLYFLSVAKGSLGEVETQLEAAARLDMVKAEVVQQALRLADEVSRMLSGLSRSLTKLRP